jgi:cell division inhibitor SepF
MSTLYRLKAYFGMVPAEDMDAYLEYDDDPGHYGEPRPGHPHPRDEPRDERSGPMQRRVADRYRAEEPLRPDPPGPAPLTVPGAHSGQLGRGAAGRSPVVHGSLAVEPPPPVEYPVPSFAPSRSVGLSDSKRLPLSRITTVHPRSYNEARTIGERYRDGIPVIINLTELDDAAAKRLVDFAAGLAFALRGSIDKVTSRVFLLSPAGVEVSAEDRRKLAEGGFFRQD